MKDFAFYNKYFCIADQIGTDVITEDDFQCLMADKKIYETSCRLTGVEAAKAMNKDVSVFAVEERTYGGLIVADSFVDAAMFAIKRKYNESIVGVLYGIISKDHNLINPYNLKNKDQ